MPCRRWRRSTRATRSEPEISRDQCVARSRASARCRRPVVGSLTQWNRDAARLPAPNPLRNARPTFSSIFPLSPGARRLEYFLGSSPERLKRSPGEGLGRWALIVSATGDEQVFEGRRAVMPEKRTLQRAERDKAAGN